MKVKGHGLHVTRKMKENNVKLKKKEASLIKRLMRISWYLSSIKPFCFFSFGALSLFSLSLTLGNLENYWSTLALDQGKQS